MRPSLRVISAAFLAAGIGLTPASAAINGTLYAVIAPTFTGTTSSYIRLFNGGAAATTFSVTVVGSPSGTTYGSANITIPKSASVQYAITPAGGSPSITGTTGAAALNSGDTSYSVYLQNPDQAAGFQHVTYNDGNGFFENASLCRYLLNDALATNNNASVLLNVHTTRLANWPSSVVLHNYWNAAVTYKLTVIDATTGSTLGTMNQPVGANASTTLSMQSIQSTIGLSNPTMNQVNIFVTDPTGSPPYQISGHMVMNTALNSAFNLTTACAVNAPVSQSNGGGGGGFTGY